MDILIPTLENLNEKFFNSKFCPRWLIENNICLGDYIDIHTQCFVTAYAIMYLLTDSAENGWNETSLNLDLPILLTFDEDQHVAVYYQNNIYESFHREYKLKIMKDIPFYKIKYDQQNFLKEYYYYSYGVCEEITFCQKQLNPIDITTENVVRRYDDLSLQENIR